MRAGQRVVRVDRVEERLERRGGESLGLGTPLAFTCDGGASARADEPADSGV
jgi:hypothetical protein